MNLFIDSNRFNDIATLVKPIQDVTGIVNATRRLTAAVWDVTSVPLTIYRVSSNEKFDPQTMDGVDQGITEGKPVAGSTQIGLRSSNQVLHKPKVVLPPQDSLGPRLILVCMTLRCYLPLPNCSSFCFWGPLLGLHFWLFWLFSSCFGCVTTSLYSGTADSKMIGPSWRITHIAGCEF